jgi:hypothetical protein
MQNATRYAMPPATAKRDAASFFKRESLYPLSSAWKFFFFGDRVRKERQSSMATAGKQTNEK